MSSFRESHQKNYWAEKSMATALYNYIVKKLDCLPGKTIVHSLNVSENSEFS